MDFITQLINPLGYFATKGFQVQPTLVVSKITIFSPLQLSNLFFLQKCPLLFPVNVHTHKCVYSHMYIPTDEMCVPYTHIHTDKGHFVGKCKMQEGSMAFNPIFPAQFALREGEKKEKKAPYKSNFLPSPQPAIQRSGGLDLLSKYLIFKMAPGCYWGKMRCNQIDTRVRSSICNILARCDVWLRPI